MLSEEAILYWATAAEAAEPGSDAARLRAQADGLVNWLREAEEDDSDESDEESDD